MRSHRTGSGRALYQNKAGKFISCLVFFQVVPERGFFTPVLAVIWPTVIVPSQFIGLFHPLGDCVFLIGPALFSHPGCLLLHRIPLLPVLQLMLRRVPDFPVYDSLAMVFHQLRLPSLVDLHGDDVSARGLVEELDGYRVVYEIINGRMNDLFVLDGIQSVSARDAILREIISNSLAHRDYSNGYVAKMVIERDRILVENGNRAHGIGVLDLKTFKPFAKNPPISKIFREIGFADELGSGMRNSYKYTKLYSGAEPEFIEGDVFEIIIPLTTGSMTKVGPGTSPVASGEVGGEVSGEVSGEVVSVKMDIIKLNELLDYCKEARSRVEMQEFCGIKSQDYFRKNILMPLLDSGRLKRTIPDKPNSSRQKYIRA